MRNPFKVGDKVAENVWAGSAVHGIGVATVVSITGDTVTLDTPSRNNYHKRPYDWHYSNLRAAIAGQDYPLPGLPPGSARPVEYEGHLPDGSGIQAHSAGGLYPFVLVWRDKRNGPDAHGKYDVGVIGPTHQDPIWCKSSDHAIAVAEALKAGRA